jgi:hypothetical protein
VHGAISSISVISVASANAPNVKALVYVDAFALEAGESIQEELASAPPPPADFTIAVPFTTPSGGDADLYVNAKYFGVVFASAESPEVAAGLAATQRPLAARCLTDKEPAAIGWKTIPSWYVMGDADKVILPDIQKKFATRMKYRTAPWSIRPVGACVHHCSNGHGGYDRRGGHGDYGAPRTVCHRQLAPSGLGVAQTFALQIEEQRFSMLKRRGFTCRFPTGAHAARHWLKR